MKEQDFTCTISAKISAQEAMQRISNVPEWWGITFSGNAAKQHDRFTVKMGGDSFFNFTVDEVIPGKRITWLITDCHMPWYSDKKEWAGTKLVFDLSEHDGVTTLSFTHEGLTPGIECYRDCETGWTHWIKTSLFSYFTIGKGASKKIQDMSYTTTLEIAQPPDVVFRRINEVSKWWPEEFEGKSARLDDEFSFGSGEMHSSKQKIVEFVQDEKVTWLVTESLRKTDNYEWTGTKMIFDLTDTGNNSTMLSFTYSGPVLENEYDRLAQLCDMVIKENLFNFIINNKTK